jgi:DUF4097 and DUF4098 domain-containing protein YvlB
MKSFSPILLLMAGVLLLASAGAGCNERVEPETEIRSDLVSVPSAYVLVVDTFNGSIEVTKGTGTWVEIKATLQQPNEIDYTVELEGETLRVVAIGLNTHINPNPEASFVITTPPDVRLELDTTNGSIRSIGVGTSGALETSNGRLTLEQATGVYTLNTNNGHVELSGVSGSFGVSTSNGHVEFEGSLDPGTQNVLSTSNGHITATIGPKANVLIDAETGSGQIGISFSLNNARTSATRTVGTLGDGGAELFLRTSNGNISVD